MYKCALRRFEDCGGKGLGVITRFGFVVVKVAGLAPKEVVRHTLRHTAITHLVQVGIDLPTVKRISGHKTLQRVERHSHQNGGILRLQWINWSRGIRIKGWRNRNFMEDSK